VQWGPSGAVLYRLRLPALVRAVLRVFVLRARFVLVRGLRAAATLFVRVVARRAFARPREALRFAAVV